MGTSAHRAERGFTLLELMAVVAIIAILAAVVIPYFFGESRKSKGKTEVSAFFAELSTKEEQFKVNSTGYFPLGVVQTASTACPATTTGQPQDITACAIPGGAWDTLRVQTPSSTSLCSYVLTAGPAGVAPTPPAGFTMVPPAGSWYFITATCDLDASGGLNSIYFTSSVDASLQIQNEGK